MSTSTRNDVKQIAQQIESLAKEVQLKIENGGDLMSTANELARNNVTFVFALGEVYAIEQSGTKKAVRAKTVSNPSGTPRNYHNLRDTRGRFAPKV